MQYYRFALKWVSCLTQHTPRLLTKSRNDKVETFKYAEYARL
ncbi:hypothetical protein [Helicobacter rodentium]|nr:hypothetical protein [Helicobacter rodentium]